MYTASKPAALAAQWLAWAWVRAIGPKSLPASQEEIRLPYLPELARALETQGRLRSVALYKRRDSVRSGDTFVAEAASGSYLLIKVRHSASKLAREQEALARIEAVGPASFRAPRARGLGTLSDGRTWSAQEMVFTTPHFPATKLPVGVPEDIRRTLSDIIPRSEADEDSWAPAHRDLTPWNLRRDHRGRLWLFDWEDAGFAPPEADHAYFHAALGLIRPGRPMPEISTEAGDYWISRVQQRIAEGHPTENQIILKRLQQSTPAPRQVERAA